jgi:hypothetical protein
MKIRILEVSEKSAHFGRPYDLTGTVGRVLSESRNQDGSTYMALTDVVYPKGFIEHDAIDTGLLILFVEKYEVVEDGE